MFANYEQRQRYLDNKHAIAYREFYDSLPEADREKLKRAKVTQGATLKNGYVEKYRGSLPFGSPEEINYENRIWMSCSPDYAKDVDRFTDHLAELGVPRDATEQVALLVVQLVESRALSSKARVAQSVISALLKPGNLQIQAYAMCFAAGLEVLNGLPSQRECARRIGVTVAALSKLVVKWRDTLGLPTNEFAKSPADREAFRKAAEKKHWRTQPFVSSESSRPGSE